MPHELDPLVRDEPASQARPAGVTAPSGPSGVFGSNVGVGPDTLVGYLALRPAGDRASALRGLSRCAGNRAVHDLIRQGRGPPGPRLLRGGSDTKRRSAAKTPMFVVIATVETREADTNATVLARGLLRRYGSAGMSEERAEREARQRSKVPTASNQPDRTCGSTSMDSPRPSWTQSSSVSVSRLRVEPRKPVVAAEPPPAAQRGLPRRGASAW